MAATDGTAAISGDSKATSSASRATSTSVKNDFYSVPMNRNQHDEFGQLQESDLLDQLGHDASVPQASREYDHIRLVSLGTYCGPKLSFQKIGRGAETLPFDWSRTRFEGLMHYMQHNFDGFFDYVTRKPVSGSNMVMYRDWYHSFWHDDPTDAGMVERYKRRIKRFMSIDARAQPVLFVRVSGVSEEIARAPELIEELRSRFGPQACLLLILNFQKRANGAGTVVGHPNLLVYFLSGDAHTEMGGAPYAQPVLTALDWVTGKSISAMPFPSLDKVMACADASTWGYEGLGGHRAFEEQILDKIVQQEASSETSRHMPQAEASLESDLLENVSAEVSVPSPNDGVVCISLGGSCLPKLALQHMGRGKEAMPFDWLRTSHDGVVHFLRNDFKDFFDYTTKLPVPGEPLTMYRSKWHSFWHDDPNSKAMREKYSQRIKALTELKTGGQPKLFVRAVTSTAELAFVGDLLAAIMERFRGAGLLLIVDFQSSMVGPLVVEGYEDLLVYFLESAVHDGQSSSTAYCKPIEIALQWMKGEEVTAGSVAGLAELARLPDETHWGLRGLGGLHAFEQEAERSAVDDCQTSPQTAQVVSFDTDFQVISLGCYSGVRASMDRLGLRGNALPFDRVATRLDGVLEFLQTDGQTLKICKDSANGDIKALTSSIENFRLASKSESPKLFVRVVATVEELSRTAQLRQELDARVGREACLLIIVDFQATQRICCIEEQYYLLVYFQGADDHRHGTGARYCDAISCGLRWASGAVMEATWIKDCASLQRLAVGPTSGWKSFGITDVSIKYCIEPAPAVSKTGDAKAPLASIAEVEEGTFCSTEMRTDEGTSWIDHGTPIAVKAPRVDLETSSVVKTSLGDRESDRSTVGCWSRICGRR